MLSHIYAITIITSSYYYQVAMKISDLQAALITISCYSRGKMRATYIGKLLFEPEIMILIDWEDIPRITATFEQRRIVASKSVAICCS